jgi:hypothetical protein
MTSQAGGKQGAIASRVGAGRRHYSKSDRTSPRVAEECRMGFGSRGIRVGDESRGRNKS